MMQLNMNNLLYKVQTVPFCICVLSRPFAFCQSFTHVTSGTYRAVNKLSAPFGHMNMLTPYPLILDLGSPTPSACAGPDLSHILLNLLSNQLNVQHMPTLSYNECRMGLRICSMCRHHCSDGLGRCVDLYVHT